MTKSYETWTSAGRAAALAATLLVAIGAPVLAQAADDMLNLTPNVPLVLIHFVLLALLIVPISRLLIGPLQNVLEQRTQRTTGALEQAEQQTVESRGLLTTIEQRLAAARQQGQTKRAAVIAETEAVERETLGRAREEATRTIEAMRGELTRESTAARTALPAITQELAREAASRLLGRAL